MMKKIFAFSLMAALVLASCSPKEQFTPTSQPDGKTIRATIEAATRTYLVEDGDVYHVLWKAGDKIRCTDDGLGTQVFYETADNGSAFATFTWCAESGEQVLSQDSLEFWGYYPALKKRALPAVQQYEAGGIAAAPMRGYWQRESATDPFVPAFEFKHLCGAIKLNLTTTQSDVKVVSIVLHADNGLSGSYGNDPAYGDYYHQLMSNTNTPVTLNCPEVAIGAEPVPFFISIPPYNYGTFSITVLASDGRTQTRSMKAGEVLGIERAKVYELSLAFDELAKPAVGATATFAPGIEMNVAIKALVNPDITNQDELDSTITKMVFVTGSDLFSSVNVADASSESPIYVLYDEATTTVTVATPAPKFVLNQNSNSFFNGFSTLYEIEGIDDFDTSNVENWHAFWRYSPKETITMPASWDYGKMMYTGRMFQYTKASTIDVSNVDFSNDTSMVFMFSYTDNLNEIIWPAEVDAVSLESIASMFRYSALSIIDMTMFKNTDGLLNIRYAFSYCPNLTKVKSDMILDGVPKSLGGNAGSGYCFAYSCENSGVLDLSEFDVSGLHTTAYNFYRNAAAVIDLSTWDTGVVESMNSMFYQCYNLGTLYLGPDFFLTGAKSPDSFWCGSSDKTSGMQTASAAGSLTIYCSQETADWLANKTILYRINTGYYNGVPTPVTFFDIANPTVELNVTWRE